ncbi:hypothetical protein [Mucilaginibacter aquariorum]|uniref:DUF3828 domain-containing protein n=1 Tax=Mucilaginibacter aquariorum TaxID=2967225 RepID=A0ABT1T5Y2_9SPHI|nr:hypothetical protein [Mucilaginibacter aquariorum]MCQ6960040.1 hypothetical protein [Mucilaginibacter aquariorum]
MKNLTVILLLLTFITAPAFSQQRKDANKANIKQVCINFLKWYKTNNEKLATTPLVVGFNPDSVKKDSILKIDMNSVETYLANFKKSGYVSDVFLNNLRLIYKRVSDTLVLHPVKDYFGPVPYLESDLIFGFGKDEILDHIKNAKIRHFMCIYNKALIALRLSSTTELVFTLTREGARWQIDYIGFNGDNKYNIGSQ